jgi:hypothetical protein
MKVALDAAKRDADDSVWERRACACGCGVWWYIQRSCGRKRKYLNDSHKGMHRRWLAKLSATTNSTR